MASEYFRLFGQSFPQTDQLVYQIQNYVFYNLYMW